MTHKNTRTIEDLDHMKKFRFTSQDFQAFTILDIPVGIEWKKIRERFKKLVKKNFTLI